MLHLKLFYFAIGVIVAVSGTESDLDVGVKRSAVCLIERVAKHNNLTAHYEKVNLQHHKNGTTHVKCRLELGTENYTENSTSFTKAKEKAARAAYALTKYSKPALGNRTCLVHTELTKSDLSLLEEYATAIGKEVRYTQKGQNGKKSFEVEISLDNQSANGVGSKKKAAKAAAAKSLIEKIGRVKIIDRLAQKFNQTKYHGLDPVQRVRKIVRITDFYGDGEYTRNDVDSKTNKNGSRNVIVKLRANDYLTTGSGTTFQEASSNAAANLLLNMNFTVTHSTHG